MIDSASSTTTAARALPTGAATMSPSMESAARYARYVYDSVRDALEPPILEIGAGFGTYTGFLRNHGPVVSCDIDVAALERVQARFPDGSVRTARVDLNDPASVRRMAQFCCRSAFSTNVFEHVADDRQTFAALRSVLPPDGALAIVVPAHPRLFGYLDEQAGHFRRYTRQTLSHRLAEAGWRVERTFYINAPGAVGWWLNHRLLPPRPLDARSVDLQLALFDRILVPIARLTDPLAGRLFGLSVAAVARPEGAARTRGGSRGDSRLERKPITACRRRD